MKRFLMVLFAMVMIPYVTTLAWTGSKGSAKLYEAEGQDILSGDLPSDGRVVIVQMGEKELEIPMEEFLVSAVAAQIPASYGIETVKAQTVLTRTWILREMDGGKEIYEEELDLDVLTREQMKKKWGEKNFAAYYGKLRQAAEETAGQAVYYEGTFIEPFFCLASAEKTRSGGEAWPYLRMAESPGDVEAEGYLTVKDFSAKKFASLINDIPGAVRVSQEEIPETIQIAERDEAGYVTQIQIGKKTYGGEEIARALGLPSACFQIEEAEGQIRATGKGSGHGYGLSQAGAGMLEREGAGYKEILQHYFQNIEIKQAEKTGSSE